MDNTDYKLLTLTDGQQVLVTETPSLTVDVGIMIPGVDETIVVDKRETMQVTSDEYKDLLKDAMTKQIEVDTMTGKAQAVMNTETPIETPAELPLQEEPNL